MSDLDGDCDIRHPTDALETLAEQLAGPYPIASGRFVQSEKPYEVELMSRFAIRLALLGLYCLLLPSAGLAGLFSEPDKNWREGEYELPPPPLEENLHEFFVTAATPNRFFVDVSSLDVGDDGIVRYVLVIRTSGGAQNVSFEGIRCATGKRRIYAHGRQDGEWTPARSSEWESLHANSYNMPRAVLAVQHFCDGPAPPRSRKDALYGLREGIRR